MYQYPIRLLKIDQYGYHPFITFRREGNELIALIDTGASCSFLSSAFFDHLGDSFDEKKALGFGHDFSVASFLAENLEIAGHALPNAMISKSDMGVINHSLEMMGLKKVDGILGSDILYLLESKIDFSGEKLFIKKDTDGIPFWNEMQIAQPNISILFEKQPLTMILDTGASQTLLNSSIAERLFPHATWEINEKPSIGISPDDLLESRRHIEVTFDDSEITWDIDFIALKIDNINVAYDMLGVPQVHAILGSDFLAKYHAIIDFQKADLFLSRR
ncbi:MAG: aspartyl protease family protein [Bacteroidales bacterium]|jgi:hypothetical protein|nr:aspartyl protease family protein [Bacteroidales bacterium]